MKTTSRKRLLVSSVAMLLVAMLALGTATYAWFTQNTTATANGLSVKTVQASELKLAKIEGEWTDSLNYETLGKVLKPASSADGVNWFAATAESKTAYTAKAGSIEKLTSTNMDKYVFADQLNVSNAGGAAVDHVTISFTVGETQKAADAGYLRVALVEAETRAAGATIKGDFTESVYAKAVDSAAAFTSTAGGTTTINAKSGANVSIDIGTLQPKDTDGSTKYFNLYVWFEGQDTDCKDANAGNVMPEITFSVTGATTAQN